MNDFAAQIQNFKRLFVNESPATFSCLSLWYVHSPIRTYFDILVVRNIVTQKMRRSSLTSFPTQRVNLSSCLIQLKPET